MLAGQEKDKCKEENTQLARASASAVMCSSRFRNTEGDRSTKLMTLTLFLGMTQLPEARAVHYHWYGTRVAWFYASTYVPLG